MLGIPESMMSKPPRTNPFADTNARLRAGTDLGLRIAPIEPKSRVAALTVLYGPRLGRCFPLPARSNAYVLGRNPRADIHLIDHTVSREHVLFSVRRESEGASVVTVFDRGGRNGTMVNGRPIVEAVLDPGDKIQVGDVVLRFDVLDELDLSYQTEVADKIIEAEVDPSTGLFTKHFYVRDLPMRVEEWLELRLGFALILIDIDHFKLVNDRFGHAQGDRVLEAVGCAVLTEVRRGDIGIRYGGDELLVALPSADLAEGRIVASRIQMAVRTGTRTLLPSGAPVTVSQGIAVHGLGETLAGTFRRVDAALLRAKAEGRDRIDCDEGSSPPPGDPVAPSLQRGLLARVAGPLRILLVEDNDDHATLATLALAQTGRGSVVDRVIDGVEALAYLRREGAYSDRMEPDLILLDLRLPRLDGHGLLSLIKSDPALRSIAVVVFTTAGADRDRALAEQNDADGYFVKPTEFSAWGAMMADLESHWLG